MKRTLITITLAAVAVWIFAVPAAAQGHSQGHGAAAGGSMGGTHEHDMNASSNASGPHSPGALLTQNKQLSSKLPERHDRSFKNFEPRPSHSHPQTRNGFD